MTLADIVNIRLTSQQISWTKFKTVKDVVGWMGAMQAQDYSMSKWAVGIRLPGSTDQMIETAIDKGEIIRTHLMRPTWHLVSSDDVYWMLKLTAPQIRASMRSRHKELGLSEDIITKSNKLFEKALTGCRYLTREELMAILEKSKISIRDNRPHHLLLRAELDGIICSGATKNNRQTYALLEERVPKTKTMTREEALAKLAKKYFSSHCPATLQDFIWWSGLLVKDAKTALEIIKPDLISEVLGAKIYWFTNSFTISKNGNPSAYLLPAYDEFIISYRDRSASLPSENHRKAISENGLFRPVILIDGQAAGLWKRVIKKDKVIIEINFFKVQNKTNKNLIMKAAETFGKFLRKELEINFN